MLLLLYLLLTIDLFIYLYIYFLYCCLKGFFCLGGRFCWLKNTIYTLKFKVDTKLKNNSIKTQF